MAASLKRLLASARASGRPIAAPGAWNALVAHGIRASGFEAAYVSGGATANAAGFPDVGLYDRGEFLRQVREITGAIPSLPVMVDADTGFGEAESVARTVVEYARAGAAGLHLEDQQFPKRCGHLEGKVLVEVSHAVEKVEAACEARDLAADRFPDFVVCARTDARSVEGLDGAIERAKAYAAAGADMIFPEGLRSEEEFELLSVELGRAGGTIGQADGPLGQAGGKPHLLANMTEFGVTPHIPLGRFGELGYDMVIYPVTTQRLAMHAVMEGLAHIRREGCASGIESRMQTRDQLYDLLDYSPTSPSGWKMPQPGLQPGRITLQRQQRRAYSTTPHRRAYSSTSLLRQGRAFSSTPPKVNDDSTTPHRRQQRGAFSSTPPPPKVNDATAVLLPRTTNQALAIGQFATDWCAGAFAGTGGPDGEVKRRTVDFFVDSVMAGVSALALKTNAPNLLRDEALSLYPRSDHGAGAATVFGSAAPVAAEKAIAANVSAVREWDTNGTVFGYDAKLGHTAGEFGHNDFYPVPLAAAQAAGLDGAAALSGMMLLDEIRGRLCSVFSLKTHKIDHVVHGAIASAATYGAMLGATPAQIESAIGMFVCHHIPWRAIRAGKQLSDSKGASAAISTEAAVLCMMRSMAGFVGPKDVFRNPEALFRQFEPTGAPTADGGGDRYESPFDLVLSHSGSDFSVMGMHFKLGIYEHQSASAIQALVDLLRRQPEALLAEPLAALKSIRVTAYEPAFGIIGDPAKRDPQTRQSADHSMVYILARLIARAAAAHRDGKLPSEGAEEEAWWEALMLLPEDYGAKALHDPLTRELMSRIAFEHGGKEYDDRYPEGIPTSVVLTTGDGSQLSSGLVMFPGGHAANCTLDCQRVIATKARRFAKLGIAGGDQAVEEVLGRLRGIEHLDANQMRSALDFGLRLDHAPIDGA